MQTTKYSLSPFEKLGLFLVTRSWQECRIITGKITRRFEYRASLQLRRQQSIPPSDRFTEKKKTAEALWFRCLPNLLHSQTERTRA